MATVKYFIHPLLLFVFANRGKTEKISPSQASSVLSLSLHPRTATNIQTNASKEEKLTMTNIRDQLGIANLNITP